ncbi:MAG: hypothetical protein CSA38_02165 [Flavobacteriales bacterium]|nr:MAG: hypothetical protein CSA38_02165 [Flavobacteriales bacterium]
MKREHKDTSETLAPAGGRVKVMFLMMYLNLFSCSFFGTKKNPMIEENSYNKSYDRDKEQISNCFIKNVEYFRKYHRYDKKIYVNSTDRLKKEHQEYYKKYPGADRDPANFFEPYATRYSLAKDDYVSSTKPTKSQLNVKTNTIIYSQDSLFCVAFLIIELKYDDIDGLESKRDNNSRYDGKAVIGYRKNIENSFQIYPLNKHKVTGFENYETTATMLKNLYFNNLKGKGSAGGIYEGMTFNQNVGDKYFFTESPYFKKHKSGLYNFMMYRHLGKEYQYNYQFCR